MIGFTLGFGRFAGQARHGGNAARLTCPTAGEHLSIPCLLSYSCGRTNSRSETVRPPQHRDAAATRCPRACAPTEHLVSRLWTTSSSVSLLSFLVSGRRRQVRHAAPRPRMLEPKVHRRCSRAFPLHPLSYTKDSCFSNVPESTASAAFGHDDHLCRGDGCGSGKGALLGVVVRTQGAA